MSADTLFVIATPLIAIGFFCLGRLWEMRKVTHWRIKWIELEHESARKEGREPRHIDSIA